MKRSFRKSKRHRPQNSMPFFGNTKAAPTRFAPESITPFFNQLPVQAKLSFGEPGDKYEQQADAIAERVVQRHEEEEEVQMASKKEDLRGRGGEEEKPIQMQVEEEEEPLQMQSEEEEEETIQTSTKDDHSHVPTNLEVQLQHSNGGGQPMPVAVGQSMQKAFGADFSSVRIHTDGQAVQMNEQLHAQAFAHGQDIYFNSGKYDTQSRAGKHLLAHELTHTLQQGAVKKVQRRALPGLAGNRIGSYQINLPAAPGAAMQGNMMAQPETVLSQESPGTFIGFAEEGVARNLARQNVHQITAIVSDDEDRYHVFPTDLAPFDPDMQYTIVPIETDGHQVGVQFENLHRRSTETDRQGWAERAGHAFQVISEGAQMEGATQLAQLMSEATNVPLAEIHIMQNERDAQAGINFNVFLNGAFGRGGIRNLPTDRTSPVPNITLQVGKGTFYSSSPDILRATFVHELTHFAQAKRSVELLQNWRSSGSSMSFMAWLNFQEQQNNITRTERLLTEGFIHNNDDDTETLAHLNTFVHAYPNLPLTFPDEILFRSLYAMTQYWLGADRSLRAQAISRIVAFHGRLVTGHQQRMAQYIEFQSFNITGHRRIPFERMDTAING